MNKSLIVVLGMHRSGTSAMTRGLKALGIDLGQNLMHPSAEQNTKGFWEDQDINAFNIELLRQLTQGFHADIPGQEWHSITPFTQAQLTDEKFSNFKQKAVFLLRDKTKNSELFGIKDPRMCVLLPFWKTIFSHLKLNVRYIIVSRNPLSVSGSLAQRNGFQPQKCHYLWLEHMLSSMIETVKSPRVVVDYDRLMEQPEAQLLRVSEKLGLDTTINPEALEDYKNNFLDKNLRHNVFQPEDLKLDPSLPEEVIEAYDLFCKLAKDECAENDAETMEKFSRLDQRLHAMAPSLQYITGLEDQIAKFNQTIGEKNDFINSTGQIIAERDTQIKALNLELTERDNHIHSLNLEKIEQGGHTHALNLAIADKDRQILALNQAMTERDGRIDSINLSLADRDRQIHSLNLEMIERNGQINALSSAIGERDRQIIALNIVIAERDKQTIALNAAIAERDKQTIALNATIAERDKQTIALNATIAERDEAIQTLNQKLTEHEHTIDLLNRQIAEHKTQANADHQKLIERDEHIHHLNAAIADLNTHIDRLNQSMSDHINSRDEIFASTSWRITKPIRLIGHQHKRVKLVWRLLPRVLQHGGGITKTTLKALRIMKREGLQGVKNRLIGIQSPLLIPINHGEIDKDDYSEWVRRYDTLDDKARQDIVDQIKAWPKKPKISIIVPVYDPPLDLLDEAIESIKNQLYPEWELCLADDASKNKAVRKLLRKHARKDKRIRVVHRPNNGHISAASNSAIEIASGDYLALFDHDDLLPEHALYEIAKAILTYPDAGIFYSDKDKVDLNGVRHEPYFKSDWNPYLFLSHNLLSHLDVYKTSLVKKIGGFRVGFEGSQDYDLALRCIEQLDKSQIIHIPKILYHWRVHPASTAAASDAKPYALTNGKKAIDEHLARTGVSGKTELLEFNMYRVRYQLPAQKPLVSLIIPTRNGLNLIKQCIDSILKKTSYPNYEIIIIDNASDDAEALRYFKSLKSNKRIRVMRDERPFNYSALNNAAVKQARGQLIGLINNDIEVISPDWLSEMVSLALQPGAGAVGARLWYPNDTLQHGGVILGIGGVAGHSHSLLPRGVPGYSARASLIQNLSAVTAACLIILKSSYQQVGGLDEDNLAIAFNDVDFCLRIREAGYQNIWTPYAELYHHESASRGYEDTPEKQARFLKETQYMMRRWGEQLLNDPAYNPNLTLNAQDFSLAWPPRIVSA